MIDYDIIIIGAGAAGLLAAKELSASGKSVLVLEAQNRIGGRINTKNIPGFSKDLESGAEFIHGDLPITSSLLKKAGISLEEMSGETYRFQDASLHREEEFLEGQELLLNKIDALRNDMPLQEFLNKYFDDDKFNGLKKSLKRFVEGFDAADFSKASTFALRDEISGGGLSATYRPNGGYSGVINFIYEEAKKTGCQIQFECIVKDIFWKKGIVEVHCSNGQTISSNKLLITVSIGVLQCEENKPAYIRITPELPGIRSAIKLMEFGTVVKVFIEFNNAFWETNQNTTVKTRMPGMDFLMSDTPPVQAWWTQLPNTIPLITGWIAGPNALVIQNHSDKQIFDRTISVLSDIFSTKVNTLQDEVKAWHVANWGIDPFACGAYGYETVETPKARDIIMHPVEDTIYFAGEALYKGKSIGTVEAAFTSGLQTALSILGN